MAIFNARSKTQTGFFESYNKTTQNLTILHRFLKKNNVNIPEKRNCLNENT